MYKVNKISNIYTEISIIYILQAGRGRFDKFNMYYVLERLKQVNHLEWINSIYVISNGKKSDSVFLTNCFLISLPGQVREPRFHCTYHLLVQTHFAHLSSHKMAKNISDSSHYHIPSNFLPVSCIRHRFWGFKI